MNIIQYRAASAALFLAASTVSVTAAELTLWRPGECRADTCIIGALVEGFQAENPDITIEIVTQPVDSYFSALLSASLVGNAPDLAIIWAGGYMLQFQNYMVDARAYIDQDIIKSSIGAEFYSQDNDTNNALYAVPIDNQFYTGFYNKRIFAENGIDELPRTWDELIAVSEKLKENGVLPIVQGSGSYAQFQPLFEWSYLAAELPLSEWASLYDGSVEYSNPIMISQLRRWASLFEMGFINEDAFNNADYLEEFETGGAAMLLGSGSWQVPRFQESMGDEFGILIPPYSEEPQNALISLAGKGVAAMNSGENFDEAGAFQAFILGDEGQTIIARFTAPTRAGFPTDSVAINVLTDIGAAPGTEVYPMFDNFTQPAVTDAIYRNVSLVLVNQMSAEDALAAIDAAFASLPEDQKDQGFKF